MFSGIYPWESLTVIYTLVIIHFCGRCIYIMSGTTIIQTSTIFTKLNGIIGIENVFALVASILFHCFSNHNSRWLYGIIILFTGSFFVEDSYLHQCICPRSEERRVGTE